jgi:hypothetical protein
MDEQQEQEVRIVSESAVDSPAGRMAARLALLTDRRPDEPRDFRGSYPGWLEWLPPPTQNFTHFFLRVGHDDGDPDYQFPRFQRSIQIFKGAVFFLSAFNDTNGLESGRVMLEYNAEQDLGSTPGGGTPGEEDNVTVAYLMASGTNPAPVPGSITPTPLKRLTVFLLQPNDGVGGVAPSWPSIFKNPPTSLNGTANTQSSVSFTYHSGFWQFDSYETGQPVTVTPDSTI